MTPGDVARILTKAAAFDQRTIGETDVLAWHEAIGDLAAGDALTAVTAHYAGSTDRLMPAHIRRHALEAAKRRRRALREAAALEAQERAELERGPTRDRSGDVAALLAELRHVLPPGDPDALRPRQAYWDREHRLWQRQEHAEPNPAYDPARAGEFDLPKVTA